MNKRITFCDICGEEIKDVDDKLKPYIFSLYKIDKGLWYEQDLCSLCYKKLYNTLKEIKDQRENDKVVYVDTDSIKVEEGKDE